MKKIINWAKAHKVWSVVIILLVIVSFSGAANDSKSAQQANSSDTKSSTANTNNTPSTPKKAAYEAALFNPANNDNTPMTLPSAGWDANDGWDTAAGWQAQLQQAQNGKNGNAADGSTIIMPAVIIKDPKTLELYVNVHNKGTAAGSPVCKIEASSATGDPTSGQYFGVNSKTITALNGGDIQPDGYGSVVDDLTISNNGARYIKAITVSCS